MSDLLYSARVALDRAGAPNDNDGAPVSDGWRVKWVCDRLAEAEATIANERGEGDPPSPGWAYHVDQSFNGYWTKDDVRAPFGVCVVRRCLPHGWTGDGMERGKQTARETMRAADLALETT